MVGLNSKTIVNQFVLDIKQLETSWPSLTVEQRQAHLKLTLDKALMTAGLPTCALHRENLSSDTQGEFLAENWSIGISENLLNRPCLFKKDAASLAEMIYHEARHSEQIYRVAELLANSPPDGKQRTAQQIAQEVGTKNQSVIQRAVETAHGTLQQALSFAQAHEWYQSIYGMFSHYRDQIFKQLDQAENTYAMLQLSYERTIQEYNQLKKEYETKFHSPQVSEPLYRKLEQTYCHLRQEVDSEFEQAQAAYSMAYARYKKLPEEADAFVTGSLAEKAYTQTEF
jgi:chromosome segregation ATPase